MNSILPSDWTHVLGRGVGAALIRFSLQVACLIACLVASNAAKAAITQPSPDEVTNESPSEPATEEEIARARELELSPAPEPKTEKLSDRYFYKYHNAITVRGGIEERFNDLGTVGSVLSVLYWLPRRDFRGIEGGADLLSDGAGTFHLASRTLVGRGRWRAFHKIGGGVRIVPSDQLVTFLRLRNWQIRIGGGAEYTISDPISLRVDLEGTFTVEKLAGVLTLGASWSW